MKTIKVKDKEFAVSITAETLQREVKRVADEINRDYAGREPVFLGYFKRWIELTKRIHRLFGLSET